MIDETTELLGAETVDTRLGSLYTFIAQVNELFFVPYCASLQLSIGAVSEAAKMGSCVKVVEHLMPLAASLLEYVEK